MIFSRIWSLLLSLSITIFVVLHLGLVFLVDLKKLLLVTLFIWLVLNAIFYRTFSALNNAWGRGEFVDKFLHDLYRFSFSIAYLGLIAALPYLVDLTEANSLIFKGGFTLWSLYEVMLLVVLLFLALVSYSRCISDARTGRSEFIAASVKAAMLLFTAYGLVLLYPWVCWNNFETLIRAFLQPTEYFEKYEIVDIFLTKTGSLYVTLVKLMVLLLGNFYLHLVKKYYVGFYVTHNHFVLAILLVWSNLFAIGFDNICYFFGFLDVVTLTTVAFIVSHEKSNKVEHTTAAKNYLFLSIFTSMCAYVGCYLLYAQYHTFSFCFFFLHFESGTAVIPNGFVVLALFLIAIKLAFLAGTFPFYKYVIEIGSLLYYPSIFYWAVLSKIVVIFNVVKFMCVVNLFSRAFFTGFWVVLLVATIYFASLGINSSPKIKVFLAYSSLANISTTLLFGVLDWKYSVFVILISFLIYAFAMFGLLLFFSCPRKLSPFSNIRDGSEVDTFENLHWGSQELVFSKDINSSELQKDVFSFFVKAATAGSVLVLMGVAPLAGFFMKFLIVSAFSSVWSMLVCATILISTAFTHLSYFALFTALTEKMTGYTKHSHSEWVIYIDEDDLMYFQIIFIFNIFASIFCLTLIF